MKTLGNLTLFNFSSVDPAVISGSSIVYRAKMVDENGTAITSSDLSSLTLSLFDTKTEEIINSVQDINILNTDRGTIDSEGNLSVELRPEDTLSDSNVPLDRSIVLNWIYGTDNKKGRHQAIFRISRLSGD